MFRAKSKYDCEAGGNLLEGLRRLSKRIRVSRPEIPPDGEELASIVRRWLSPAGDIVRPMR